MICQPCRDQQHHDCPGGTHCPCQHRPPGTATDQGMTKAAHPEGQTA